MPKTIDNDRKKTENDRRRRKMIEKDRKMFEKDRKISKITLSSIARVRMSAAHRHNRITLSPEKSKKEKEFKDYFKLKMVSFHSFHQLSNCFGNCISPFI